VPLLGIEIVPVTPVGAGLTPGDTISVEPRGMPVGETAEPVPKPSGEVAPMVGVGLAIPLTCAMAALQSTSAGRTAAINENLIGVLRMATALPQRALMSISFATIPRGARLSDIGQSLRWRMNLRNNLRRQMPNFLSSAASNCCCLASYDWFKSCSRRIRCFEADCFV
jgi:hypothetical protein